MATLKVSVDALLEEKNDGTRGRGREAQRFGPQQLNLPRLLGPLDPAVWPPPPVLQEHLWQPQPHLNRAIAENQEIYQRREQQVHYLRPPPPPDLLQFDPLEVFREMQNER